MGSSSRTSPRQTFTNAGTFDVPANANGSTLNVQSFTNTSTGAFSVEGNLTIGNTVGSTVTNQGSWTLGSAATMVVGGSSSFVMSGSSAQLTDNNTTGTTTTANNNSVQVSGNLVVDGGTICGNAPDLHGGSVSGADSLVFGSSFVAGPSCGVSVATDQIALGSGTNTLSGNVPAAYTVTAIGDSVLEPTVTLTSNGAIILNNGQFIQNVTAQTFTNAGTFDVPANANGSTLNVQSFTNTSTGAFSVEGNLTIGNTVGSTVTNQGSWTLGSAATMVVGGSSSFVMSGSSAQLTDNNTTGTTATANNNSLQVSGNLVVDGGTICGNAPDLHGGSVSGADSLVFGSSFVAGPSCGVSVATDQIALGSGTNTLSGNVPAAYTVTAIGDSVLEPTVTLTSNGAIILNNGQFIQNVTAQTFTNAGTFDVPANANGSTLNVQSFTNTSTGAFSVEGNLTIGNTVGTTLTNDGTLTLGSAGTVVVGGGSSLVQDGVLTDNNVSGTTATANNNSLQVSGNLVVDGGTICGNAPDLHGGSVHSEDSLVFGTTPMPGPDCAGGVAEDQIALGSGTNTLSGNVPAAYTLITIGDSVLEPTVSVTSNGAIILDNGQFTQNVTAQTFTNAGTFDVPANANGSTLNVQSFTNTSTGAFSVEGNLTVGNTVGTTMNNDGTIGVAPGGLITVGGSSSITNKSDGLLAFGIDGPPSSTNNYGRIIDGTLALGGTADPVFDNGFIPLSGTEYFVYSTGTFSGTFATVLHNASADYSHAGEVGLTGGGPATPTSTIVTSSALAGSVYGQSVQFTATVTPNSPSNPTGSVSFFADGLLLGSSPVTTSGGVTTATVDVSNLRVGSESITATYNGNVVFDASTSTVLTQPVALDPSDVTVVPSPASPVPGQLETYTVEVSATSPGAGTPTGPVSLTDNGTPIAGCQNLIMGPLGPSFVMCSVTYPTIGGHSIVANYAGDTDFASDTGNDSITVQPATTSTVVGSSANPGPIGAPVTYTATVSVVAPGTGTPTGTVSFTDNGNPVGGCQSLSLPVSVPLQAICTETYGSNASHAIVATYSGDTNDASSHGSLGETLQQISTQTTIGASTANSTYGQDVTFTATVTPTQSASVNPSGTVTFVDNGSTTIGSGSVSTTAGVTTATLDISNLGAGFHSVTATYNGDTTFTTSTSSSPATLTVAEAITSMSLSSSANPSVVGQSVTFTATLSSSASGETGTVDFADSGVTIGSESVSGGQATFQTSALALGGHTVTAVYEGDFNFVGSSSSSAVIQQVDQASTSVGVSADHNPGSVGQTITYTATVTVNSPGSGVPTETVSFSDGGVAISSCQGLTLPAGPVLQVTCAQTYGTNVSHTITATYSGDNNFVGATSDQYTENLAQTSTTTSVQASTPTSNYGQSVTLTATVSPNTGSGNPTGSVTFTDNGTTTLGSAPLSLVSRRGDSHPPGDLATGGLRFHLGLLRRQLRLPRQLLDHVGRRDGEPGDHQSGRGRLGEPLDVRTIGHVHRHHHAVERVGRDRHGDVRRQRDPHRHRKRVGRPGHN